VLTNGADAGLRQIKSGVAWHYKQYQNEQDALDRARYARAETESRAARRGLWALPAAQRVPPWEWRHGGNKQPAQAAPAERTAAACGSKRYCREMVSCEEARHYLSAWGLTRLDRESDGVPCEVRADQGADTHFPRCGG
jgi:hypothetical protein